MTTAVLKRKKATPAIVGPESNGRVMSPREFDHADFEDGWRYELINGVLVVSQIPSIGELDPNDELGFLLRSYQEHQPQGSSLNLTVPEWTVRTGRNRRRVDRCIWANLSRLPTENELPTIAIEFVSSRKRDRQRDYETKREEYLRVKIKEYWIIDRFERCMVVFARSGGKTRRRIVLEDEIYTTELLPGFELPLKKLLALGSRWETKGRQGIT